MKNEEEIILVAKMYTGEYIENNIGHEIINFFKPDNKEEYYGYVIYNGKVDIEKTDKIKSILFVSDVKNRKVKVIAKVDNPEFVFNIENQADFIEENNIKYGGVLLNEIMDKNGVDEYGIYITYKAQKIMKPKNENTYILLKGSKEKNSDSHIKTSWNIGHTIGYISSTKKEDNKSYKKINDLIKSNNWKELEEKRIDNQIKNLYIDLNEEQESFMDIVHKEYDETVFSNMLFYYLGKKKMLQPFVKKFFDIELSENAKIEKEKATKKHTKKGRIDLWIEDEMSKCCIVIENKIKSGINGRYYVKDKNTNKKILKTQLDKYIEWVENFKEKDKKENKYADYIKKYYIFVPNYKKDELEKEMLEQNLMPKEDGEDLYKIISYKEIYDYFNSEENKKKMKDDIYYIGFLKALSKHIYTSEKEMERKFVCAINKAEDQTNR